MKPLIYVFDVDGTLTPSRGKIEPEFKDWFLEFFTTRPFALVSGSDRDKLLEQLGPEILDAADMVFACSANSIWIRDSEVYKSPWGPDDTLINFLQSELNTSQAPEFCGNHIEVRTGLVNFSTVGRDCNQIQRKAYFKWDNEHNERKTICERLMKTFPNLTAEVGGEISIDIYPTGLDKSQVIKYLDGYRIYFFGDGIKPGKNDWSLAQVLDKDSKAFPVVSYLDTWNQLKLLDTPVTI